MPSHVKKEKEDLAMMAAPEVVDYYNRRFDVVGRHDKVTDSNHIRIRFTYPLDKPKILSFSSEDGDGFTKDSFYKCIYQGYMKIYKEHPDTIWGHNMDDLFIEDIIYDKDEDIYELCIGS
jgi:hypothetical protein